jgi:hypothetical protein
MKNIKPASEYAKPHTMSGKKVEGTEVMDRGTFATNKSRAEARISDPIPSGVSYGVSDDPKSSGIEMRGFGAATKGKMSRGPMA